MSEFLHSRGVVRFGAFALDPVTGELHNAESTSRLQPQPLKVLLAILNRPGELVSREQLKKELLLDASYGDPDHAINLAITKLRYALKDSAEHPRFIETLPRLGYRFIASVDTPPTDTGAVQTASMQEPTPLPCSEQRPPPDGDAHGLDESTMAADRRKLRTIKWLAGAVLVGVTLTALFLLLSPRSTRLTDKDTVVLAAFKNTTGDAVFDNTLRHGLSAHLRQSPFLRLLSDDQIAYELYLMTQPKGTQLTNELARDVCKRTASAATIEGSISSVGSQYVLHLRAVNCESGELLADEQATANGKDQVLKMLGEAATKLRQQLGELLPSIEKYPASAENVTTPSLEALQAYSRGYEAMDLRGERGASVTLFQRAISLDPNFAMAYALLGTEYVNLGQTERAAYNIRIAYALREHVSGPERLYIEAHNAHNVLGNLEAARKIYTSWMQIYPRDPVPVRNLGVIYFNIGQYDKALPLLEQAVRLAPECGMGRTTLGYALVYVGRLDDAKAKAREADTPAAHLMLYRISFLEHDTHGMEQEMTYLMGVPDFSDDILSSQADTAAYTGKFAKARAFTQRASDTALLTDQSETAAAYHAAAAVREALVGNAKEARAEAQAALIFANSRYIEAQSAIALALTGDSSRAKRLVGDLAVRFPEDTILQHNLLPTIHSAIAMQSGNSLKAVEVLAPAETYDLATSVALANYYPIYLRGQAYLATHQPVAAAAEFQKIHDHPGVVANNPIGALAYLGTGRAYALAGNMPKARAAYEKFLTLWKDADADIPLFKEAKAEYARLH